MGFNGSPFLLDPESIPRVVSLSFRSSIVGKKLYVGNLTYNVNESDLEALFTPFGTVQSAQVIVDRDTNRSKGFGFVEMGSDAEAQAAIQGLNGHDHDGRNLTVNEAKPREERGGGGGRGGYGGGGGEAAVAVVMAAVAVGVIEHSILPQGQGAFSTGLLDRPAPIIDHRVFFPDVESHRSWGSRTRCRRTGLIRSEQVALRGTYSLRWESSPFNPVLKGSPEDKLIANPKLTADQAGANRLLRCWQ